MTTSSWESTTFYLRIHVLLEESL
jgi:hypothetical protein